MKHNFSIYDLPTHELPLFEEQPGSEWINYGFDNLYGDYLRDLYLGSSIHTAVVNGVAEMIAGEGIDATDRLQNAGKREQWLKFSGLMEKSSDDLVRRLSFDMKLYGMAYIQVIWNRSRTGIAELRHISSSNVRSGKANADGVVKTYYVSARWDAIKQKQYHPRAYPAFSMEDRTQAAQILQIKAYQPGIYYYGLPDYVGSTNYIELDREIGVFHLNNIKNGLFPSMLLNFNNGIPTDEERREIERKVNEKFSGSSNAGRLLISFSDGNDNQPQIESISANDAEGMYQFLSQETTTKILAGHRVTSPLLFGVRGVGAGFGNNADELRDSYSLFSQTVVLPFQNLILECIGMLAQINGIELDLFIKPLQPANFIEVEAVEVMTPEDQAKEGVRDVEETTASPQEAPTEETPEAVSQDKEASYNGAQISSALDIIIKVGEGLVTKEQAIVFLIQMLQFDPQVAEALFREGADATKAIERLSALKKKDNSRDPRQDLNTPGHVADKLIALGEDIDESKYELIDEREVNYNTESTLNATWNFASVIQDTRNEESADDSPLILVRYYYAGDVRDNTREFCRKMMQAGKFYRREDLDPDLSPDAVTDANPGFGERGSDNYNVWLYKGGPRCRHFWLRATFLRKDNRRISVTQARKLINDTIRNLPFEEREQYRLPQNDRRVAMQPNEMPRKGFSPRNPNLPRDAR